MKKICCEWEREVLGNAEKVSMDFQSTEQAARAETELEEHDLTFALIAVAWLVGYCPAK